MKNALSFAAALPPPLRPSSTFVASSTKRIENRHRGGDKSIQPEFQSQVVEDSTR